MQLGAFPVFRRGSDAAMAGAFDAAWRLPRVPPRLRRCEGGDIGVHAFVPPPETGPLGCDGGGF